MEYTDGTLDVPSPIDFRDPAHAQAWVDACETAVPGRTSIREAIGALLRSLPPGARVLELGAGPGLLAHHVLEHCSNVGSYTLLDFSPTMLEISRQRLAAFHRAHYMLGNFKSADWARALPGPYDAIVAMQAVHEIRHKRHVPGLYATLRSLLLDGGLLAVADHTPKDDSLRWTCLHMSQAEQLDAFYGAGFPDAHPVAQIGRLILVAGQRG
ncbi:MAG: methyltransferase [Myxococcales bacterium]